MAVYDSKYNGAELDDALDDALSHIQDKSNPHNVTKAQVGLGNVGNFKAVSTESNQGLTDTEKSNARTNLGLGSMATKDSLAESDIPSIHKSKISDFPTSLPANGGNSSTVNGHTVLSDVPANAVFTDTNTWRPLGTGATDACAGNDSRLSDARPASDVYDWAKASVKPTYTANEVGACANNDIRLSDKRLPKNMFVRVLTIINDISISGISATYLPDMNGEPSTVTHIYENISNVDYVVTVATTITIGEDSCTVHTPDGNPIELTCPAGGYCEVNFVRRFNDLYARGI